MSINYDTRIYIFYYQIYTNNEIILKKIKSKKISTSNFHTLVKTN